MNKEQQLEWEARWGRPAAAAAVGGILLPIAGGIYQSAQLADAVKKKQSSADYLRTLHANHEVFVVSSVFQALGIALLAGVLLYLFRVVRFRRPQLPQAAAITSVLGPLFLSIAGILLVLDRIDHADAFVASGAQTAKRADDLLPKESGVTLGAGLGGAVALAFSLVSINVGAIRSGVLSKFLGVIGAILGALFLIGQVLPFLAPLILQLFWLGAMAVLFLDRWPGGRGPAWASGEPEPWPSAAEVARARQKEQEAPEPKKLEEPSAAKPSRKRKRKK